MKKSLQHLYVKIIGLDDGLYVGNISFIQIKKMYHNNVWSWFE